MKLKQRTLEGTYEITLSPNEDERGFFMRTYDLDFFKQAGIHRNWVQENHSKSKTKGIIRGLHFQFPPFDETKLIRCIRGAVYDAFLDLRKDSPTFGHWDAIELSEQNRKMVFIPKGFAHGFCTLTDESEVLYKVNNTYHPQSEGGIIWNDTDLSIPWPTNEPILSEKDSKLPTFKQFIETYGSIDPDKNYTV